RVEGENISFAIVLKTNDSDLKSSLNFACMEEINKIYPTANTHIHVKTISDSIGKNDSVLPQVKNVIAVGSGKGGVGKSTVSVNLAVSLSNLGYKVGLIDADLYGPSIPTMMGLVGQRPKVELLYGKHKIIPLQAHGVHVISVGFIVEPEQAVVLRGPRLGGLLKQFIQDCLWPELDYLIIDLPPGTGDIQLTLVQTVPVTGAIIVTTPQEVSVIDAVKAMNMFLLPNVNVPILGVVENMSWFTPQELPANKYFLFGQGGGKRLAAIAGVELIAQIPIVQSVREGGDAGIPVSLLSDNILKNVFNQLAESTVNQVKLRHELYEPTRIVKMEN
ncbi:MAG: Mrp/NBP35 family ATP-binding protein, partial [Saprospiraceae bacterium]|nr:Mrp/NBP35 family ATP-binding protein [Saprospiraceae bacterium]